ncbi:substrate-binding periplasmic protein [Alkalimarinus alittae]|uniref:Transporter substrate-binding domain-containing protein n=1 Tax=Alkalimarinus alittae TaxID=2961619 RepID=A0ABY6N5Q8_9ALTE|nr:transporter substrate-binding domain-containing protein [Alkalimarinus alittae]UZE97324.1 transporter substrate-binding domain-containing protein [Alkalimarinus alittae]
MLMKKQMPIFVHFYIALVVCCLNSNVYAETVRVYVETPSVLVDEEGRSLGISVFKAMEKVSDLRFKFTRSTYSRALLNLKKDKADVVLHLPYGVEPGFDEYGIYLDWSVPVKADLYAVDPKSFKNLSEIGDKQIGIPRGNAKFASKLTGIPQEKFYEVDTMNSLIKMLAAKRVDLIWFDRVAVRQALKQYNVSNIYYYEYPKLGKQGSIGVGLQNTERGRRLKKVIDELIPLIDVDTILAPYYKHLQPDLPATGKVNLGGAG